MYQYTAPFILQKLPDRTIYRNFQYRHLRRCIGNNISNIHKIVISKRIDVQRRAWNHFEDFFQQIPNLSCPKEEEVDFPKERERQQKKKTKSAKFDQWSSLI